MVAKGGAKLKAAVGGEDRSDSFRLNAGGLTGQGVSMVDFARAEDKTGRRYLVPCEISLA